MFDNVKASFTCPECGHSEEEFVWQTKALDRILETYEVGDELDIREMNIEKGSIEIHEICPECDKYISGYIHIEDGKLTDEITNLGTTS
ncbi:MAG: hypothetical protein ACLFVB_04755 [Thermoplasmata archaeon]